MRGSWHDSLTDFTRIPFPLSATIRCQLHSTRSSLARERISSSPIARQPLPSVQSVELETSNRVDVYFVRLSSLIMCFSPCSGWSQFCINNSHRNYPFASSTRCHKKSFPSQQSTFAHITQMCKPAKRESKLFTKGIINWSRCEATKRERKNVSDY